MYTNTTASAKAIANDAAFLSKWLSILRQVIDSLPPEARSVFERFLTCEYTTIDVKGRPITWPVFPYYKQGSRCVDVTTGLGYPKKANDARVNPKVSLLFSYGKGSGLDRPPTVLVQGYAEVDDRDLVYNSERCLADTMEKYPNLIKFKPPKLLQRLFNWYFTRIYIHVTPETVYLWPNGDTASEPIRFGHSATQAGATDSVPSSAAGKDQPTVWDERLDELGSRYPTAVLSFVDPNGFPGSVRVPVNVDQTNKCVRIEHEPHGLSLVAGAACLTAHDHNEDLTWDLNFQVRGQLHEDDGGWRLEPQRLVGGIEMPPTMTSKLKANIGKQRAFRKRAKQELRARRLRTG